jgi:RNA polymerase sigma factor for flagellar operon FliA
MSSMTAFRASRPDIAQLFLESLPVVDGVVRTLGRRYRLSRDDQDEFAGAVRLRLLEDDYGVLRRFEGRSSLRTYLKTVVTRLFLDERVKAWGRWRPSADAIRLGPVAVALERLLERQHLPLDAAIEALVARDPSLDGHAIRQLANALPRRVTRRVVPESELETMPSPTAGADHLVEEAEANVLGARAMHALQVAMAGLPARERMLLRLQYEQGATVADISRVLQEPQKPLYRQMARLRAGLRRALEAQGISIEHVRSVASCREPDVEVAANRRLSSVSQHRPGSPGWTTG